MSITAGPSRLSWEAEMGIVEYIVAILGLSAVIAWHELGHYSLGLFFNMRVLRYGLGIGPKAFGTVKNGIEYQVSWIPFGGFVQVFGVSPLEEGAAEDPKAFLNQPRWQRFIFYAAGPGFNYFLAAVIFFIVGLSIQHPVENAILVGEVAEDTAAKEVGLETGNYIVTIDGKPVASDEDFLGKVASGKQLHFLVRQGRDDATTRVLDVTPRPRPEGGHRLGHGL